MAVNPITGLQTMDPNNVGMRSVAVVINNSHAAIPQRGISAADAIYEYQTEGGQTRLLAVSFPRILQQETTPYSSTSDVMQEFLIILLHMESTISTVTPAVPVFTAPLTTLTVM